MLLGLGKGETFVRFAAAKVLTPKGANLVFISLRFLDPNNASEIKTKTHLHEN